MRYADMGNFNVRMPHAIAKNEEATYIWMEAIREARLAYQKLAELGIPMQDVRTVCPIATETYIICEYPLSEFLNTYAYRACYQMYPETVALFHLMGEKLIEKCPWLESVIKISCEKTSGGINGLPHKCTFQGWERVEGSCPLPWALEENRVYKSTKVER
jgi:thymidylate synthase ThyX